ncbi:MAG: GAF domain-containing protein [Planctomycetota bacterium]
MKTIKEMHSQKSVFDSLINKIRQIVKESSDTNKKLLTICQLLKDNVSYYNWVGFYLSEESPSGRPCARGRSAFGGVDKSVKRELVLGPFVGEATEHTRIPFGKGICGQAADRKTTFVVQDTGKETNYLACSLKVKSEIVIPIFKGGEVAGELDIDSHTLSPFTQEDRKFLENICEIISELF